MPAREEEVVSVHIDPVLPPARRRAMRDAGLWHDRVLLDDLERHVDHAPQRIAVVGSNSVSGQRTALTYAELARRADRIAGGLAVLGVEPGDIVSYQSPNWWEFVALHLALLRLGAVSNPLMPIFREHELGFMLGLAGIESASSCRRRSAASTSSPWRSGCGRGCRRCATCWRSAATGEAGVRAPVGRDRRPAGGARAACRAAAGRG